MQPSESDADDLDNADSKTVQLSKPGVFQASKEQWLIVLASYPNLSGADYAVALVIAKHLNSKSGLAWPSIELMSKMTNRESSTVWRSVEKLEKLGLLTFVEGEAETVSTNTALDWAAWITIRKHCDVARKHCELEKERLRARVTNL